MSFLRSPIRTLRSASVLTAFALALLVPAGNAGAEVAEPTLDPNAIPKYTDQLVIPPAMPKTAAALGQCNNSIDYYEIAVRQFRQQLLPAGMPKTTVWGYGSANHPSSFAFPGFTIEAKVDRPVRVKWINQLVNAQGNFLPHLLPVDQTVHWANPPGPRDMMTENPNPYLGPVPIITHLHGAHTPEESDGYPEAWYLPNAKNIPAGFFKVGSKYDSFKNEFRSIYGVTWAPGTATFQYPNDQRATALWYHDHVLGMTRLNVYAGLAGFYLLRGGSSDLPAGVLPGPAPAVGDPPGKKYYEIPILLQDRSFNKDGSLFFPNSRAFFDGFTGPYIPQSDISPIYNPEFFGETIVVNGKTWPNLNVEPRRYRFRLLDGANARSYKLKLITGNPTSPAARSGKVALPFWQIGADGGFLPKPVKQDVLLISLAERADVIVDFSCMKPGTKIYMINRGPDMPLNGTDDPEADVNTTGQVMRFTVVPLTSKDRSTPPAQLNLPAFKKLGPAVRSRELSLNELDSAVLPDVGPRQTLLGTLNPNGTPNPLHWSAPVTENPRLNDTEIWEIYNFTEDGHPIHLHQVQFEIIDRTPMGDKLGGPTSIKPAPGETGTKDTVIAYPAEVTRIKARFDLLGLFVWHCHIIDHEDNEMMRPYRVIPR